MISSASSQQRLSDSTVIVPIKSLKNALLVKADRDNLKKELVIARDSISNLQEIILSKDTIIFHRDSTIALYKDNESKYKEVINNKDSIITTYGKEIESLRASKNGAYIAAGLAILLSIFFGL